MGNFVAIVVTRGGLLLDNQYIIKCDVELAGCSPPGLILDTYFIDYACDMDIRGNRWLLAYTLEMLMTGVQDIKIGYSDNFGDTWFGLNVTANNGVNLQGRPSIISNGTWALVAWKEAYAIYTQFYDISSMSPLTTPQIVMINSETMGSLNCSTNEPDVEIGPDGMFVLVAECDEAGVTNSFVAVFEGNSWSPLVALYPTSSVVKLPSIAYDNVSTWMAVYAVTSSPEDDDIFSTRSN